MKRYIITSLMLFYAMALAMAQETYISADISEFYNQVNRNKAMQPGNPNVQGSPFLSEEFTPGTIYFDKKYKIEKVPLRLNLYNGDMEFKDKNVVMAFSEPKRIDKVILGDQTFIYLSDEKEAASGFVRMWNTNAPAILTKMKVVFYNKDPEKGYSQPKPDRFERAPDKHYLLTDKGAIEKISSLKKLIAAIGNHETELTEYAKWNKISTGKIDDLVNLLEYYHSLSPDRKQ
jgi:hypothetical protein